MDTVGVQDCKCTVAWLGINATLGVMHQAHAETHFLERDTLEVRAVPFLVNFLIKSDADTHYKY